MGIAKISAKVKYKAIQLVVEDGLSVKAAAAQMNIGFSTLGNFVSDFKKNGNKIKMEEGDSNSNINTNEVTPKQFELINLKNKIKQLQKEKLTLKNTIAILMNDEN